MLPFALDRNQNFEHCWKDLTFGFKFLFLFMIGYNIIATLFSFLIKKVVYDGYSVVHEFELWRILIPHIPAGPMPAGLLNVLINFLWLLPITPALEKKYSTAFILVEMVLQNFLVNVILSLISIILFDILSVNPEGLMILNFGIFPLCQIFIWQKTAESPDEHTKFCCMPCLIPMKWIPILILLISVAFSSSLLPALAIASLVGYLQFMRFKKRLIKLPLRFYRRIDHYMPKRFSDREDYVKVRQVEASLQSQCRINAVQGEGGNPFQRNHNVIEEVTPAKVEAFGKGVSIGGGQAQNFKGVWAQKADEIQVQPTPAQEPVQNNGNVKPIPVGIDEDYFQHNDSNMRFGDGGSLEDQSEDGLQEKDEKKVAKQNLLQ